MTTLRPVRCDDAAALLALQQAHDAAVLGRPDTTADDVHDQLADPDLDPRSPVLEDDTGQVVGCALVMPAGDTDHVDLDLVVAPSVADDALGGLLQRALAVAADAAARLGHRVFVVDQGCHRADLRLAEALRDAGFEPATTFHRMRRELDDDVHVHLPAGVVVERVNDESEPALRRAHHLHTSTFAGHFGFVARSWEDWSAAHQARSGNLPLWFATLDGRDAGFLQETAQYLEDQDAGYVSRLGVAQAARGRGIGRALLLSSFADMRRRGHRAALLHVDSANATGATALYEGVGMCPVLVIDIWRASLPATDPPAL